MKINHKLGLTVVLFLGSQVQAAQLTISPSTQLPSVSGKSSANIGQTMQGHDLTVVQFWASWCVGCGAVMADLATRTKTDSSIGYASISVDEDMETARNYFKSKPSEVCEALPNVWLDGGGAKLGSRLNIKSLPFMVITNEKGDVVQSISGHPKSEELTAIITKLRDKPKSVGSNI